MVPRYMHMITLKAEDEMLLRKVIGRKVKIIDVLRKGLDVLAREKGIIRTALPQCPENTQNGV